MNMPRYTETLLNSRNMRNHSLTTTKFNASELVSIKDKFKILLWQLFTIMGLNIAYIFVISEVYDYMGFEFEFVLSKFVIGTLIIIFALGIGFTVNKQYFSTVWNIVFLYILVAEIIYFQFNPGTSYYQIIAVFACLVFVAIFSKSNMKIKASATFKNYDKALGILAIILFLPFLVMYYDKISLSNLLLDDIYVTRSAFAGAGTLYTGYVMAPLARILLPVLIASKIKKKQKGMVILYSCMLLYLFLCGALKSILIGLLAIIFFYSGSYVKKTLWFLKGVSFLCYVGTILYFLFGNLFLLDAFVRRVFFIPARLGNSFFQLFNENGKLTYFSHSPLSFGLVEYEYNVPIITYAQNVFGGGKPNVGMITEGIFSLGIFGGIISALIISLILLYFYTVNIDKKFFGIIFIYIYYMQNSLLSILLLTHGLLFLMVFSHFFLRVDDKSEVNSKIASKHNINNGGLL